MIESLMMLEKYDFNMMEIIFQIKKRKENKTVFAIKLKKRIW